MAAEPQRMDLSKIAPDAYRHVLQLEGVIARHVDRKLLHLIKLRASQINGCAYCVDMHSLDLRAEGETEQRIYALPVWRETPFFTERERAALLWTEKLTLSAVEHVPDEVYEQVRPYFTDEELVNLTLAIAAINAWNRFAVSFRSEPGHYTPKARPAKE